MIELVHPLNGSKIRFAVFDFDGTLSLIREGWQQIIIPMMVEIFRPPARMKVWTTSPNWSLFVTDLTGKQTIYQMIRLVEEGGKARRAG